jgi:hypothetical protein
MNNLLQMIQQVSIQEALALTVREDMKAVIADMKAMFADMTEDKVLEYGLDQSIISIEDIDAVGFSMNSQQIRDTPLGE